MLYYDKRSTSSRKVEMALDLLGLPLERCILDLPEGGHKRLEFQVINPNGALPILVEESGFVLWESNAIMQYLAAKIPDTALWPNDPRQRADIARWQFWESGVLAPAIHVLLHGKAIKQAPHLGDPDACDLARGMRAFNRCALQLDNHLRNRLWVAGHKLTLADLSLASQLGYARDLELPLACYPRLVEWLARVDDAWRVARRTSTQSSCTAVPHSESSSHIQHSRKIR